MSGPQDASRRNGRRKRVLSAQEKYQIWQQLLTGELTQRQAAEQWNVDPTTIMRIRRVGREGALERVGAVAAGGAGRRGGVQDAELAAAQVGDRAAWRRRSRSRRSSWSRCGEKRARAGRPGPGARRRRRQGGAAGVDRARPPAPGWSFARACRVLGLSERRARYWQARQAAGALEDRRPGGRAVHALRPEEITAILALADRVGRDRRLAPQARAPRLLPGPGVGLAGDACCGCCSRMAAPCPTGRAREKTHKRPWPDWVEYRPYQVWGYDFSEFPASWHQRAGDPRPRLAQVDRHAALPRGHPRAGASDVHQGARARGPARRDPLAHRRARARRRPVRACSRSCSRSLTTARR